MTKTDEPERLVAGESFDDLAAAFRKFKLGPDVGGYRRFGAKLAPEQMQPMMRALMRIEAELLLEDVDQVSASNGEPRSAEERRYDALIELINRFCGAPGPT